MVEHYVTLTKEHTLRDPRNRLSGCESVDESEIERITRQELDYIVFYSFFLILFMSIII